MLELVMQSIAKGKYFNLLHHRKLTLMTINFLPEVRNTPDQVGLYVSNIPGIELDRFTKEWLCKQITTIKFNQLVPTSK